MVVTVLCVQHVLHFKTFLEISPERQDQILVLAFLYLQFSRDLKRVRDFQLTSRTRFWIRLSYMCNILLT